MARRHLDNTEALTDEELLKVIYAAEGRGKVVNVKGREYYAPYQDTVKNANGATTLTIGTGFTKGHPYADDSWFEEGAKIPASVVDAAALRSYRNDIEYAKQVYDSIYGTPSPLGVGLVHPSDTLSPRMLANVGQMLHKAPRFTRGVPEGQYNSNYHTTWLHPAMKALATGNEKALNAAFMNGAKAGVKPGSVRWNRVKNVASSLPSWPAKEVEEDTSPRSIDTAAQMHQRRVDDFETLVKAGVLVPFKPYK